MAKWTCKIVDIPRNGEMETVATEAPWPNGRLKFHKYRAYLAILHLFTHLRDRDWCSTADGNGSCHRLAPSFFEEMTHCWRQKHHWRWPGNSNGRSKFHKYCSYLPILCLRNRDWCPTADGGFQRSLKWHEADIKNIASDDQITLRINWNFAITKIYAYEIKQDLSKKICLLLWHHHYDAIAHCFFPTITCNGFCSHLRKIISRRPWLSPKTKLYILKIFCVDSMHAKIIDIIK